MTTPSAPAPGCYIVLEGFHRGGKSTQMPRVQKALAELGIECTLFEEPPRPGYGRDYVQRNEHQDPAIAALLMYADRRALILDQIVPLLEQGTWVLCSRNFFSSFHLQGQVGGLGVDRVGLLHNFAMDDVPDPNLIVFMDNSTDVLAARATDEHLDEDALERSIRKQVFSYGQVLYEVIKLLPDLRIKPVNADGTREEVTTRIMATLQPLIQQYQSAVASVA